MKPLICLDLDNTLLKRQEAAYQAGVIGGLCRQLGCEDTNACISALRKSINHLIQEDEPAHTLEQKFFDQFHRYLKCDKEIAEAAFYSFYDHVYDELAGYITSRQDAISFVADVIDSGFDVVIATNPIYPRAAIIQRLTWAGLEKFIPEFSLITTIENFHFAKPSPAYYAEIMGKLGWPENCQPVMVGDSLENDIEPAKKAGFSVFWLNDQPGTIISDQKIAAGNFSDLSEWLARLEENGGSYASDVHDLDLLALLRATPTVFHSVLKNSSEALWRYRPAPGEWSLIEITCHLRDADQFVNIPRFEEAFSEDNPFLPSIETDSWASECNYQQENVLDAVGEFTAARTRFIRLLESFTGEWWKKMARHSVFGPTCLAELVLFILTHDKIHIRQMQKTLEKANNAMVSANSGQ